MRAMIIAAAVAAAGYTTTASAERLLTYTAFGTGVERLTQSFPGPSRETSRTTDFHISFVVDVEASGYGFTDGQFWNGGPGSYDRNHSASWLAVRIADGTLTARQTGGQTKFMESSTLIVSGLSGSLLPQDAGAGPFGGTISYSVVGGGGGRFLEGTISHFAVTGASAFHGFVLNTVPEPATWATMTLGIGAVGGSLRRRHRSVVPA